MGCNEQILHSSFAKECRTPWPHGWDDVLPPFCDHTAEMLPGSPADKGLWLGAQHWWAPSIHRPQQPLPQSNLNTFSVPKGQLLAMSSGSLSFPKFSNKESTSESMTFLSWMSYGSGIKQRAALCEWLPSAKVSQAHLAACELHLCICTSWILYLHFLSAHYSLLQGMCELQIKFWSPGSERCFDFLGSLWIQSTTLYFASYTCVLWI